MCQALGWVLGVQQGERLMRPLPREAHSVVRGDGHCKHPKGSRYTMEIKQSNGRQVAGEVRGGHV